MNYKHTDIDGLKVFYREAGDPKNPAMVLLHGFPSSSFMYRNLMAKLADRFYLIAPDYPGFGNSDAPPPESSPTPSTSCREVVEKLLEYLGVTKFTMFIQDYGSPVGFRIALRHPDWIEGIVSQNGNAYEEGFTGVWDALRTALWKNRTPETEAPLAGFFSPEGVKWIYSEGTRNPKRSAPTTGTWTCSSWAGRGITASNSTCSTTTGPTSSSIQAGTNICARISRRRCWCGARTTRSSRRRAAALSSAM